MSAAQPADGPSLPEPQKSDVLGTGNAALDRGVSADASTVADCKPDSVKRPRQWHGAAHDIGSPEQASVSAADALPGCQMLSPAQCKSGSLTTDLENSKGNAAGPDCLPISQPQIEEPTTAYDQDNTPAAEGVDGSAAAVLGSTEPEIAAAGKPDNVTALSCHCSASPGAAYTHTGSMCDEQPGCIVEAPACAAVDAAENAERSPSLAHQPPARFAPAVLACALPAPDTADVADASLGHRSAEQQQQQEQQHNAGQLACEPHMPAGSGLGGRRRRKRVRLALGAAFACSQEDDLQAAPASMAPAPSNAPPLAPAAAQSKGLHGAVVDAAAMQQRSGPSVAAIPDAATGHNNAGLQSPAAEQDMAEPESNAKGSDTDEGKELRPGDVQPAAEAVAAPPVVSHLQEAQGSTALLPLRLPDDCPDTAACAVPAPGADEEEQAVHIAPQAQTEVQSNSQAAPGDGGCCAGALDQTLARQHDDPQSGPAAMAESFVAVNAPTSPQERDGTGAAVTPVPARAVASQASGYESDDDSDGWQPDSGAGFVSAAVLAESQRSWQLRKSASQRRSASASRCPGSAGSDGQCVPLGQQQRQSASAALQASTSGRHAACMHGDPKRCEDYSPVQLSPLLTAERRTSSAGACKPDDRCEQGGAQKSNNATAAAGLVGSEQLLEGVAQVATPVSGLQPICSASPANASVSAQDLQAIAGAGTACAPPEFLSTAEEARVSACAQGSAHKDQLCAVVHPAPPATAPALEDATSADWLGPHAPALLVRSCYMMRSWPAVHHIAHCPPGHVGTSSSLSFCDRTFTSSACRYSGADCCGEQFQTSPISRQLCFILQPLPCTAIAPLFATLLLHARLTQPRSRKSSLPSCKAITLSRQCR